MPLVLEYQIGKKKNRAKNTLLEEKGNAVRSEISGVHGSLAPAVNETDRICRHVDTTCAPTCLNMMHPG